MLCGLTVTQALTLNPNLSSLKETNLELVCEQESIVVLKGKCSDLEAKARPSQQILAFPLLTLNPHPSSNLDPTPEPNLYPSSTLNSNLNGGTYSRSTESRR